MKKIAMIVVVLFTTYAFGQKASKDYTFFQKAPAEEQAPDMEGTPAEPGDPVAPIDDYLPALAAVGVGMAVYFGRKRLAPQLK